MSLSNYLIPLIAFVIFANPAVFKLVRGVAGSWVASSEGLATNAGLLLHAVIFVLVVGFLMRKLRRSNYQTEGGILFNTRDDADDAENKHFQQNRIVYAVTN
jgi:cbb3-type cytochrome oxidase subunit 3